MLHDMWAVDTASRRRFSILCSLAVVKLFLYQVFNNEFFCVVANKNVFCGMKTILLSSSRWFYWLSDLVNKYLNLLMFNREEIEIFLTFSRFIGIAGDHKSFNCLKRRRDDYKKNLAIWCAEIYFADLLHKPEALKILLWHWRSFYVSKFA